MLWFKTTVATMLCFVAITVIGAPTTVDFHVLNPRSNETYAHSQTNSSSRGLVLPTVPQLVTQLRPLVPKDKSLFYSGGVKGYRIQGEFYATVHKLKTIWDFGDQAQIEAAADLGQLTEYWKRMSEAYAVTSWGRVWVLMPGDPALGMSWFPGSIWDTIEWPALEENALVTNVFRVNPLTLPAEGVDILPKWSDPPRR